MGRSCRAPAIVSSVLFAACGEPTPASTCVVEATAAPIGDGPVFAAPVLELGNASLARVDDSGVYWITPTGDLQAVVHGTQTPLTLAHEDGGGERIRALTADAANVYWAWAEVAGGFSIRAIARDGREAGVARTLASGTGMASALLAAADQVYVATGAPSALVRVPMGGGRAVVVATAPGDPITALAADASHVYFAEGWRRLARAPHAGGPVATITGDLGGHTPVALRVHGDTLFFAAVDAMTPGDHPDVSGRIGLVSILGGCPRLFDWQNGKIGGLAVDGGGVHFTSVRPAPGPGERRLVVWRLDLERGRFTRLHETPAEPVRPDLTATATHLYWFSGPRLFRAPRDVAP